MCLMPHKKAKAQSGLKSFNFVSHGILGWWLHTEQQCWPEETLAPAVCSQISPSSFCGDGSLLNWHLQNVTTADCFKEVKEGTLQGDSEPGYLLWEMYSLIGVFLYQFLNCYPLLLLTFLPFACGCQNVCNVFRAVFLSKKKRNLALKRTRWQKKRK